jgi:hypothetical protein
MEFILFVSYCMMLSQPVYSVSTQITKPYVEIDMVEKGHGQP